MARDPEGRQLFVIREATVTGKHFTIELDEAEFNALHAAKKGLFTALAMEEKYGYIVGNFREFELSLLQHSLDGILRFEAEWSDLSSNIQKFNRLLVNLLTSCRLYHDQVDREVAQLCGHDSPERRLIKQARSSEFDTSASYRVMEGLRNYIQHQGLPLRRITLDTARDWECPQEAEWRTVPYVDGIALIADGGFKKRIADDLSALGSRIDVRILMRDCVQSMARIHRVARAAVKPTAEAWVQLLLDALDRYEKKYQRRKHIEAVSLCGESVVERFAIFEEPIKELNDLDGTLTATEHIAQHFVSNRLARSGPNVDQLQRMDVEKQLTPLLRWQDNWGTD